MPEPLLERVAAAVAQHYRDLPLRGAAGILIDTYWDGEAEQLAPDLLALTEVNEDVAHDGDQENLGAPEIWRIDAELFALCRQLNERFEDWQDEAFDLTDYWFALAAHLRALTGLPVLVADVDSPLDEQVRRQTASAPQADPLAGLDVLIRVPIDDHQVAAVVQGRGWRYAFSRVGDPEAEIPLGTGMSEIGRDPHVVAGLLAHSAAGVVVQDRAGTWHEAAVGGGAWLCVLPQRAGVKPPPISYLGADGRRLRPGIGHWATESPYEDLLRHEAAVCKGAAVPALWPTQAIEKPVFSGWEGPRERATGLLFVAGRWVVSILEGAREPLRGVSDEPGTVDGQPVSFQLVQRREGWVASATTEAFTVVVECSDLWFGLDLVRLSRV